MTSATAARISWLYPAEREVYNTRRPPTRGDVYSNEPLGHKCCTRCGGCVSLHGTGQRTPVAFSIRDRGTTRKNVDENVIHRGCVPTAGEKVARIGARALPRG